MRLVEEVEAKEGRTVGVANGVVLDGVQGLSYGVLSAPADLIVDLRRAVVLSVLTAWCGVDTDQDGNVVPVAFHQRDLCGEELTW